MRPRRLRRIEPVLRRALRGPCALPPGSRLLVAVSGGADSVALLLGLRNLVREFSLSLHAAHLNHGLRGREADRDLDFVRGLCARLGVPLQAARWDCRARLRRRGLSGEAGLRALRREFLERAARRARAAAVATAHSADDQLETVLMRLLRGAGLAGLGGMRPRHGRWLKPLLESPRSEIEADLRGAGEAWREDASNQDRAYLRNRLRHDAIPALLRAADRRAGAIPQAARAGLARRVSRAAAECRAAARFVERHIARALPLISSIHAGEIALDSRRVATYPTLIRTLLLRRVWALAAPAAGGLTHRHLEALSRLIAGSRGSARVELPGRFVAERDAGWVRLRRAGTRSPAAAGGGGIVRRIGARRAAPASAFPPAGPGG